MANTALKITELIACTSPTTSDVLVVVSNVAGNSVTAQITTLNLLANGTGNVVVSTNNLIIKSSSTPANSTVTGISRSIWFDDNYIYCVTSNNIIKRAALNTF